MGLRSIITDIRGQIGYLPLNPSILRYGLSRLGKWCPRGMTDQGLTLDPLLEILRYAGRRKKMRNKQIDIHHLPNLKQFPCASDLVWREGRAATTPRQHPLRKRTRKENSI